MTNFDTRCAILSEVWIKYRDDEALKDFIEYNDLGLPLAHFIHKNFVSSTEIAETFINETYELLVKVLRLEVEDEYDNLAEMLEQAEHLANE